MSENIAKESGQEGEPTEWSLWREDIYGNQVRVPLELADEDEALAAQDEYTAKGHHQTYHTRRVPVSDTITFIPARKA